MSGTTEEPKKLGQLLVEAGIISADQLAQGLAQAKKDNLPLGRVLITLQLIRQHDLESALYSQSLMKLDRLPASIAVKAVVRAHTKNMSVDSALTEFGWLLHQKINNQPRELAVAQQGLDTAISAFGSEHPEVAVALTHLADRQMEFDRPKDAEQNYSKASKIVEAHHGSRSKEMVSILQRRADVLFLQDRFEEAEQLYWRILELKKELYGEDHIEVAKTNENLAELYDVQSQYLHAERFYLESLGIKTKVLEEGDPQLVESLKKLVFVCKQRNPEPMRKTAGELLVDVGLARPDKVQEGLSVSRKYNIPLGNTLIAMNEVSEQDMQRVLQAQVLLLDGQLPPYVVLYALKEAVKQGSSLQEILDRIGWQNERRSNDGENTLLDLLRGSDRLVKLERARGADHPDVAVECKKLASLYMTSGSFREAEMLLRRALHILEEHYGLHDLHTLMGMAELSECLVKKERKEEAQAVLEKICEYEASVAGEDVDLLEHANLCNKIVRLMMRFGQGKASKTYEDKAALLTEQHNNKGTSAWDIYS